MSEKGLEAGVSREGIHTFLHQNALLKPGVSTALCHLGAGTGPSRAERHVCTEGSGNRKKLTCWLLLAH